MWNRCNRGRFAAPVNRLALLLVLLAATGFAQSDLNSALFQAVDAGDAATVATLLQKGASVNALDANRMTPLMHAARTGHLAVLRALLKAGAEREARDPNGFTSLAMAASVGHADVVQALVQAGADANAQTRSGATPLMFAAFGGHITTVAALLRARADANAKTPAGITALMMASNAGHAQVVAELAKSGASVNAADDSGRTALMLAASKGHTAAAQVLMAAGADVNLANKWGDTALTWAANEGRTATVQALLAARANVEAKNEQGATALLLAARGGFMDVLNALLKAGAEIQARDENGRTAVMFAAWNGRTDILKMLLQAHADPNAQDKKGETALMHAAVQGQLETLLVLIDAGADVNAKAVTDSSALMSAAFWGRKQAVEALLRAGADPNLKDSSGKTAAQLAREAQHPDIELLLAAAEQTSARQAAATPPAPPAISSGKPPQPPADAQPQPSGDTKAGTAPVPATKPGSENSAAAANTPQFQDITHQAGISFRHTNGATPEKYLPETMGSGGLFLDYDNDGWLDIFLVDSGSLADAELSRRARNTLYRNNHDGTFTDVTGPSGLKPVRYGMGACAADFDNDGRVDIYVTGFGGNALYRNAGDGVFTDVTVKSGAGVNSWSTSCAWGDFNKDGYLDLYVANYVDFAMDNNKFCGDVVQRVRAYCHPNVYKGLPDVLLRNHGDGTFTDVTKESGIASAVGNGLGVVVGDYDNDGWPDIYVANDSVPNFLWRNRHDGAFEDAAQWAGVAVNRNGRPEAGMGTDMGDMDNDGLLDIFVTNLDWETNTLYANRGEGLFADLSAESGLGPPSLPLVGFGTAFFDYDNDGLLDVVVTNGNVLDNAKFFRNAATYAQPKQLFHNAGGGKFKEVGASSGPGFALVKVGRGLAVGDMDNDGDLDILVTNNGQTADLLRNDGVPGTNSLLVRMIGQKSNRDGVGARLILTSGSTRQIREVKAGSSYLGQNDPRVHFGLGSATRIIRLEVRWPSGIVEAFENLDANQILTIVEGKGITHREPFRPANRPF